jgi:hypothetical protein
LLVVLTTNAPPVQPIRAATSYEYISNNIRHYPDIYEAWDLPSTALDRLLVSLSSKLPIDADASGQHTGPVILLSGDVHHSFASRILYRATKRFEDDTQPRAATAVFAQLVASPFKKEDNDTRRLHREGYYAVPRRILRRLVRRTLTEGYVGWNFPTGSQKIVGTVEHDTSPEFPGETPQRGYLFLDKGTVDVTPTAAQDLSGLYHPYAVELTETPHYRYRFDYLLPTQTGWQAPVDPIAPLPGASLEQRKEAARVFKAQMEYLRVYNLNKPPKVVGVNNFGEIRFDWGAAASRKVNHIVRWWSDVDRLLYVTTYSVRLDINSPTDPEYPDIKARVEP